MQSVESYDYREGVPARNVTMRLDGDIDIEQMAVILKALYRVGFKRASYAAGELNASRDRNSEVSDE